MSKYAVGDKFIVEVKEVLNDELPYDTENLYRIDGFKTLVFDDYGLDKLQKYDEVKERLELIDELKLVERNKGMMDAWELARKLILNQADGGYTTSEIYKIFDTKNECNVLRDLTYQEALAKIESYEESKAIKVGNVVIDLDGDERIVLHIDFTGTAQIFSRKGVTKINKEHLKKTGKTVDIEHLLEQIRGE